MEPLNTFPNNFSEKIKAELRRVEMEALKITMLYELNDKLIKEGIQVCNNDEPKHTKAAAYITNIYQDRLLVLWRNKWENEGTPLILPGGGCLENESLKACALREVKEEIGLDLMESNLSEPIKFETKWANEIHFFNLILPFNPAYIRLDSTKFSGCLWIPVNNLKLMEHLYPLSMHGLQQLMEYMKWV